MPAPERKSAFNYCNPFDHVLPGATGGVTRADRAHLWGLYTGILPSAPVPVVEILEDTGGVRISEQIVYTLEDTGGARLGDRTRR